MATLYFENLNPQLVSLNNYTHRKMKLVFICLVLHLFGCFHQAWTENRCMEMRNVSDAVHYVAKSKSNSGACWLILPEDGYVVTLVIEKVEMDADCDRFYMAVTTSGNETNIYCNGYNDTIKTTESVRVEIIYEDEHNNASESSIFFKYQMARSIFLLKNVNETKGYLVSKLLEQARTTKGWGEMAHRATTALYLAGATHHIDKKEMRTQLDLLASSALLMNSTHPLSANELSMIVNSLTVACQNPRQFYDQNILQILEKQVNSSMIPNPKAILSICIAGGKLENTTIDRMFYRLMQNMDHSFNKDHRAMSLLALTCLKKRTNSFEKNPFASGFYEESAKNLIKEQRLDGSFGNVYTTALVTQALIGTGQVNNKEWKLASTLQFLIHQVNSSDLDLQMQCLILPVLNNKSLVDLGDVDCSNRLERDKSEFQNGTMMQVFYSLFMGDEKKLIKTINVIVPTNSSAYSVMNKAQEVASEFSFQSMRMAGSLYIFKINGIANDFESGKIWTLYTMPTFPNGTLIRQDISAEKLILHHWEHLIMWYKTTDI